MKCKVEECDREAKTRGMCSSHYNRWSRYGDPTICKHASHGEPLRFLYEEVLIYKGDDCLYWPYGSSSNGYGQIIIDKVKRNTHAIVCEKVNGPRPSPRHVASHTCGQGHKGCVNPKHLKWQTYEEDCADKVTHGTAERGSQNGMSKLTEQSIREIRSLEGKLSQEEIAKRFGVTRVNINNIILRKTWAWLK